MTTNEQLRRLADRIASRADAYFGRCGTSDEYRMGFRADAEELRALAATPDDGRPVDGWRPIETAPKDGSLILIATPIGVVASAWNGFTGEEPSFGNDYIDYDDATHWRPLPTPPTARPEVAEDIDTARLDWLEDQMQSHGDGYTEPRQESLFFGWSQSPEQPYFPGLRKAIDEQRAQGSSAGDVDAENDYQASIGTPCAVEGDPRDEQAKAEGDAAASERHAMVRKLRRMSATIVEHSPESVAAALNDAANCVSILFNVSNALRAGLKEATAPKLAGGEAVAEIYEECGGKHIQWLGITGERDLPTGTKLYPQPQAVAVDEAAIDRFWHAYVNGSSGAGIIKYADVRGLLLAALAPGGEE